MMNRRSCLQALGLGAGASILFPLLRKLGAQSEPTVPRFVFVVEGNGVNPGNFLSPLAREAINEAGGSVAEGDRVINRSYGHESLIEVAAASLQSALALASLGAQGGESLEAHSLVTLGLSSKVSGGGHTGNYGALSCAPSRVRLPSMPTIDHLLANVQAVREATPFDALRLGIHSEDPLNYNTCAAGAGKPMPIVCDPTTAFLSLFGSVAPGAGAGYFQSRRNLLDFMREDSNAALELFSGSSQERMKLEQYLASIEQLTQRHETIEQMGDQLSQVMPDGPGVSPLYESTHNLERMEAMFELATASLIGGLTNVVVLASGTGERGYNLPYTSLGLEDPGRHSICHAYDYESLTRITERHVSMMSQMARALQAVPEGNGTMLDHTIIVYTSDNGEKHHSNAEEWPLLVVGGSQVGMKLGGRCLVYPAAGREQNRQLSNFFSTLTHLAQSPIDDFGVDESRIASGPLADIMS